jgi:indolepyruvate ferredoxin oxidoreductase
MAYKDEYEVGRLHLLEADRTRSHNGFADDARMYWHLHPPILRSLGMKKKIVLGPWFAPVFKMLAGGRRLRGTLFDPFGFARVRRVERKLIRDYRDLVGRSIARLTRDNRAQIAELLSAVDIVRGYEEIKLANVETYRERVAQLELEST